VAKFVDDLGDKAAKKEDLNDSGKTEWPAARGHNNGDVGQQFQAR